MSASRSSCGSCSACRTASASTELRPMLQQLVRIGPTIFIGWMYPVLDKVGPVAPLRPAQAARRRAAVRRDRRTAHGVRSRRPHRRAVQAAGGGAGTERRGAARPPDHLAAGRSRDHRVHAGLGAARPVAAARAAGPRAAGRRRGRRRLPRGGRQGGHAVAAGDPQRRAAAGQAGDGRRLRPAGRRGRVPVDPPRPAQRGRVGGRGGVPPRTLPGRATRRPPRGSRSAAGCVAASAPAWPPSRRWRC